jgi:hypothetical protein
MISELVSVPEAASPVLGVVAVVLLATGYFRKCGIYSALGMNTKK